MYVELALVKHITQTWRFVFVEDRSPRDLICLREPPRQVWLPEVFFLGKRSRAVPSHGDKPSEVMLTVERSFAPRADRTPRGPPITSSIQCGTTIAIDGPNTSSRFEELRLFRRTRRSNMKHHTRQTVEDTEEQPRPEDAGEAFMAKSPGPAQGDTPSRRPRVVALTCRPPFVWSAEYISDDEWDLLYGRDNKRFHKLRLYIPESVSRHDIREAIDWLRAYIPEPETEPWTAELMDPATDLDGDNEDDAQE